MMPFFFFKQKTAYEIRPCDWSSDVCSSDLDRRNQDDGADGEAHSEETLGGAERLHLEYGDDVARQQAENEEQQTGARGGQRLGPGGSRGGFGRDGAAPGHDGASDTNAEQEHEQHQREGVGRAP